MIVFANMERAKKMDDYISRQMAMDSLNRAVCDYCVCPCDKPYSKECNAVDNYSAGMRVIEALPSADVVEVVRCKDCIHFLTPHGCGHIDGMVTAIDDGFCSYGERRADAEIH